MALRTLSGTSSRETANEECVRNSSATTAYVINDSDLASSWIYTSRKEAANEVFDTEPNVQVNSASPSRRCCKICCRLTVSTIITLCIIGIFSTIAGIIYLEFFASERTALPYLSDDGGPSVKLSGHTYKNGNPGRESSDLSDTIDEQHIEYLDEFDFKKSSRATSSPPRRGKALPEDEPSTPDVSLLHAYVNGTINTVKNVFQMIKDASDQERNSRMLDLLENNEQQGDFAYDGSQSFLQKLTSFLFGTVRPIEPVKSEWDFNILENAARHLDPYADESLVHKGEGSLGATPNGEQNEELGSGETGEDTVVSAETDLSKMGILELSEIFAEMGTLKKNTKVEDVENRADVLSSVDFPDDVTTEVASASPKVQRKSIATEDQSSYLDLRNKISSSMAELFKLFSAKDKTASPVTSPSNDLQENLFHRRTLEGETRMPSRINNDSTSREREQYLQRLRNIMLTANAIG